MKKIIQYLLRAPWRFSLIICVFIVIGYFSLEDLCSDTTISEIQSPNKLKKAVVFERDCGATTNTVFHVTITGSKINNEEKEQIICSIRPQKDTIIKNDNIEHLLTVSWVNDAVLEIKLRNNAEAINRTSQFAGVAVIYK